MAFWHKRTWGCAFFALLKIKMNFKNNYSDNCHPPSSCCWWLLKHHRWLGYRTGDYFGYCLGAGWLENHSTLLADSKHWLDDCTVLGTGNISCKERTRTLVGLLDRIENKNIWCCRKVYSNPCIHLNQLDSEQIICDRIRQSVCCCSGHPSEQHKTNCHKNGTEHIFESGTWDLQIFRICVIRKTH